MTTNQPLSLFISSKMTPELSQERRGVQAALSAYQMRGWLWETDQGARSEPAESTYLGEVAACDIYIGLFWLSYGPYTIDEYRHARKHDKPCLVYEKHVDIERRDPRLQAFLEEIEQPKNPQGLTARRFHTTEELAKFVQKDVMDLLITRFRETRQQPLNSPPTPIPTANSISITADIGGIAIYDNSGTVKQYNYSHLNQKKKRR